ncbi:MAG: hypothetical protein NTV06_10260, partial [candidate division Zixibacteria bacterium]|nr:hypothetical protein [candidate division Zixibacteria bacterium]
MNVLIAAEQILNRWVTDVLEDIDISVTAIEPVFKRENILNALRQSKYDLVILTNSNFSPYELPGLAAQIKQEFPAIKMIVVTGFAAEKIANPLAVIGIDAFMIMPMKIVE